MRILATPDNNTPAVVGEYENVTMEHVSTDNNDVSVDNHTDLGNKEQLALTEEELREVRLINERAAIVAINATTFALSATNFALATAAATENDGNGTTNTYRMSDVETAVALQEFATASVNEAAALSNEALADNEDSLLKEFDAFELEYKRRKQVHDEYLKAKAESERLTEEESDMKQQKDWESNRPQDVSQDDCSEVLEEDVEDDVIETIGEIAPFSFLISNVPFDFQKYITINTTKSQKRREKNIVWISKDHLPVGRGISDKYVHNRMRFVGLEDKGNNFQETKDELATHKHLLKERIKAVIRGFWAEIASRVNLTYNGGTKVDSWRAFQNAIREHIANVVLASCNYKILNESSAACIVLKNRKGSGTRKKRSFIIKLISQAMTDARKGINLQALNHTGFTYTKTVPEEEVDARSKDKQSHLRFYDWMIMGEYNGKPYKAIPMKKKRINCIDPCDKSSVNKTTKKKRASKDTGVVIRTSPRKKTIKKKQVSRTVTKSKNLKTKRKKTNSRLEVDEDDSSEDDYSVKAETEDEKHDDSEEENEDAVTIGNNHHENVVKTRMETRSSNKKTNVIINNKLDEEKKLRLVEAKKKQEERKKKKTQKCSGTNKKAKKNNDTEAEKTKPFACEDPKGWKHDPLVLAISEDSKYCTNGQRFDGVTCAICGALFVAKVDISLFNDKIKTLVKPTSKHPMYCCGNSKEYCTFALCFDCKHDQVVLLTGLVTETINKCHGKRYTK